MLVLSLPVPRAVVLVCLALCSLQTAEDGARTWEEFRLADGRVVQGVYTPAAGVIEVRIGNMMAEVRVREGDIVSRRAVPEPPPPAPKAPRPAVDPAEHAARAALAAEEARTKERATLVSLISIAATDLPKATEAAQSAAAAVVDLTSTITARTAEVERIELNNAVDEQYGGWQWNAATQSWVQLNKRNYDVRTIVTNTKAAIAEAKRQLGALRERATKAEQRASALEKRLADLRSRLAAMDAQPAAPAPTP